MEAQQKSQELEDTSFSSQQHNMLKVNQDIKINCKNNDRLIKQPCDLISDEKTQDGAAQKDHNNDQTDEIQTKVYNYGSCEIDQFWLPHKLSVTKRPYLNNLMEKHSVIQIACGSLHILLLTKYGLVFSSGQNDEGALGRVDESNTDEESDKKSKLVSLPIRVNMISAGSSHSIAANSELGVCFQWGAYRNTERSYLAPPARFPIQVGMKEFENKTIKKVLSGTQHSLVLTTEGEVFGWGDPDMGVIGRVPRTRHGYDQALKVAKITHHKAIDISTGDRHSFMKRTIKKGSSHKSAWFSWGLNNFGQLGLDVPEESLSTSVIFEPTQMNFFDDLDVIDICGGESHSLALLADGSVYAFGRNDVGQFGIGGLKSSHPLYGSIQEINPKPIKIDTFPKNAEKIEKIWAGPNYNYAKDSTGQCFSWGFGANFVLGNRKDEDEDDYLPYSIPRDFFKNSEVPFLFSLGSQHVSYLVLENNSSKLLEQVPKHILIDAPNQYLPRNLRTAITAIAKEQRAEKADNVKTEEKGNQEREEVKENKQNSENKRATQLNRKKSTDSTTNRYSRQKSQNKLLPKSKNSSSEIRKTSNKSYLTSISNKKKISEQNLAKPSKSIKVNSEVQKYF